jgi:hypothetical protein
MSRSAASVDARPETPPHDQVEETGEKVDWLGRPLRCSDCPHHALRDAGGCQEGRACVRDRRARRVDRFFAKQPELADEYLHHPYFEVRTVAAKYASMFRLPVLLEDPEPEVRATALLRLPERVAARMCADPDRRVRLAVASRVSGAALVDMRRWVARRISPGQLERMTSDVDPLVRLEVARRLPPRRLRMLAEDEDLRVRFTVAERVDAAHLPLLANDPDDAVRAVVDHRLQGLDAHGTR